MVEAARQCSKDRKVWRALVLICNWMSFTRNFSWPCVPLDHPPLLWWLSPGEGWDAVTWCGWDKLWKGRNYWKSRRRCQVYGLRRAVGCLCVIWLGKTTPPWWREKVMLYYYITRNILFTHRYPCDLFITVGFFIFPFSTVAEESNIYELSGYFKLFYSLF